VASKGLLKRTLESKKVKKAKKCKTAHTPVKTPVMEASEEEDIDSTVEDERHREMTHDEVLEAEWKKKMERMRQNRDEAIAKLNKRKLMY
jgi:hypothetical protein